MANHPAFYTVRAVAERIARAQFVGDDDIDAIARFLRVMLGRGLIVPSVVPQGGVTAPNLFDEAGVYRAALLIALSRAGVSDDLLSAAAPYLDYVERERDIHALRHVLSELADGNPQFFHLYVAPKYFGRPGDVRRGTFSASSDGGMEPWTLTITVPLQGLVANLNQPDELHDARRPPAMKGD